MIAGMHDKSPNGKQPRLAVIDPTLTGTISATGSLKANLLAGWPDDLLLHIYRGRLDSIASKRIEGGKRTAARTRRGAEKLIAQFAPDCVLYRPVPGNSRLHGFAMDYLRHHPVPLVIWIMDDWPQQLRYEQHPEHAQWDDDLRWLLNRASVRLCISDAMAEAYAKRYGSSFEPVANGVEPEDWLVRDTESGVQRPFTVRYAGSLAATMTFDSVLRVAGAIEQLAEQGQQIRFEINTQPMWARRARWKLRRFKRTALTSRPLGKTEYRAFLQGADALLIAYNFDERSNAYVSLSLANKLPECLIAGPPLLVHGPSSTATVAYMDRHLPACVVNLPETQAIASWLLRLINSNQARQTLAESCRALAIEAFSLAERREKLATLLTSAASEAYQGPMRDYLRKEQASLDESAFVSELVREKSGAEFVMLDVGAHRGSSLEPFLDRNWSVLAFEPDAANRQRLLQRFGSSPALRVDGRAVADFPGHGRTFYQSEESDGISGMLAFHESHQATGSVDVTTIADAMHEYDLDHIDFLKIDVEGMDFAVLRGVPWERTVPRIVLCEFEDAKTRLLGHSWRQIADYLQDKGYVVYVSEWHPITRYGVRHQWRSLTRYPCELANPDAWGNLLAFRVDVPPNQMISALDTTVSFARFGVLDQIVRGLRKFVPGSDRAIESVKRLIRRGRPGH